MRSPTSQFGGRRHLARWASLAGLIAILTVAALPASASAAPCPINPGNATAWKGGSGSLHDDAKWTNGTPSGSCDVSITATGDYTVSMTAGANAKSLTLGGTDSTPHLVISDQSPNTNFDAQPAGITIAAGASVTLTCLVGGCPGGGPDIYSGPSPFANAGVITVDANTGGGAVVGGQITNTGTLSFAKTASLGGKVTNQGSILVADGATVTNSGSSCGDTGALVKNDTGGLIDGESTGLLSVRNFEQGAGTTEDVTIPCGGTLNYTGGGPSEIRATGGFNLTGEMQAGQSLTVSAESSNTNATLQSDFTNKGSITLTCTEAACPGGSGGAGFNVNDKDFVNAGTFTVAAASGTGASVGANFEGTILNTGTMDFKQSAGLGGPVTNKGAINIADTKVVTSSGSSCADTGARVKNDTGGSINATGSGTLSLRHYEQGDGTTTGTTPVQLPCGSVNYTGNGSGKVLTTGGFNLSGEMQSGQELVVSAASSNTNVTQSGNFTNKGTIVLTCPESGCSGGSSGGVGFNAAGNVFTNAGIFTIAAASGTGSNLGSGGGGTILNTGTMNFDQTGGIGGLVVNEGKLNIANGKTAFSTTNCGDTGPRFKHEDGEINGAGTGNLNVTNFEQGDGTTSGSAPVILDCGSLKYTGTGASTIRVNGFGMPLTGSIAAGQTLRIHGSLSSGAFTNAGTIVFDQSSTNPGLNTGTVTNTGKIELQGSSVNTSSVTGGQLKQTGAGAEIVVPAGTKLSPGAPIALEAGTLRGAGTISGSVENTGGVVKPGDSPGTLTLSGSYVQGTGGRLEIEIAGTGAGQFDQLALGGTASLDGTLALVPTGGYADTSAIGDSVAFLTYGGSVVNQFAETTVSPLLSCGKAFATSNDSGAKALKATVVDSGASCGGSGGGGGNNTSPPPSTSGPAKAPNTKLGKLPAAKVKTKAAKAKVKFTFSADVAGATFQCKLDKGAYRPCSSPKTYKVKPGKHKFSVRAVGPGGTDPTPATFSFKVIRQKS